MSGSMMPYNPNARRLAAGAAVLSAVGQAAAPYASSAVNQGIEAGARLAGKAFRWATDQKRSYQERKSQERSQNVSHKRSSINPADLSPWAGHLRKSSGGDKNKNFRDTNIGAQMYADNNQHFLLNGIVLGSTANSRIGRTVNITSVQWTGYVNAPGSPLPTGRGFGVKFAIVYDK